jgi:hypothetical protein
MMVTAGESIGAKEMSGKSPPQAALDNHANQLNPAHPAYYLARGESPPAAESAAAQAQAAADDRARAVATETRASKPE